MKNTFCLIFVFIGCIIKVLGQSFTEGSSALLPTFTQNKQGKVILYWTEKAADNNMSLFYAISKDNGTSFEPKILIHQSMGLGAGRLAKPKLLFKKDGSMAAIFSYRTGMAPPPKPAATTEHTGHGNMQATTTTAKPKRDSQIMYTTSQNGIEWTIPVAVDSDTSKLTRGFFDAVVLPNDEIAVAYLKDVKNSKLHEERDLRMAITQNGIFQTEKLLDAIVCDCCNINLLVDKKSDLNILYRDNNNDVRDISVMVSSNNGLTFKQPKTVHADGWEIKGCPHTGASSIATTNGFLSTWYSGTSLTEAGVRLVNQNGKLIKVQDQNSKNGAIFSNENSTIWAWEQLVDGKNKIYYSNVLDNTVGPNKIIEENTAVQNPSVILLKNKKLMAYEMVDSNKKSTIKIIEI